MSMGEERTRIRLDIKTGELEVDAAADQFKDVVRQVSEIIPSLKRTHEAARGPDAGDQDSGSVNSTSKDLERPEPKARKARASRAASGSSRGAWGAAKYHDFQPIKLGISDEAELELRSFYEEKQPKGQEEQVATIIFKLTGLLGRDRLNYDQIYQGFRVAGEAHPPKSLAGVVSNMAAKMLVERENDGVRLKIQGSDLVDKGLPRKNEK